MKRREGQLSLFDSQLEASRQKDATKSGAPKTAAEKKSSALRNLKPSDVNVVKVLSKRRKHTVSAKWEGDNVVVMAPANLKDDQLQPLVDKLVRRLLKDRQRHTPELIDLEKRAQQLNKTYFDGKLKWTDIRWAHNQEARHGSCNPRRGTIRISSLLAAFPAWVLDYVIVHELAHLVVPNHSQRFWNLVNRYPFTERARGYLIAKDLERAEEAS